MNIDASGNTNNIGSLISNVVNGAIVRVTGSGSTLFGGVSGFVFDIIDDEEIHADADITDHYIEDNFAIEDHIAIRPVRFMLRGFVGEVSDILQNSAVGILQNITSLASIGGFLPEFAAQSAQTYNKIAGVASKVGNVLNQAQNIYNIFTNANTTAQKQQAAFKYFYDLWRSRTIISVETPFMVFNSMAIESIRAVQKGDSRIIADFVVGFKEIRTVSTKVISPTPIEDLLNTSKANISDLTTPDMPASFTARVGDMVSTPANNGQSSGQAVDPTTGRSYDIITASKPLALMAGGGGGW